jgi:hypothetical protein
MSEHKTRAVRSSVGWGWTCTCGNGIGGFVSEAGAKAEGRSHERTGKPITR